MHALPPKRKHRIWLIPVIVIALIGAFLAGFMAGHHDNHAPASTGISRTHTPTGHMTSAPVDQPASVAVTAWHMHLNHVWHVLHVLHEHVLHVKHVLHDLHLRTLHETSLAIGG